VTPNSPIYFYQFTTPYSNNTRWTGRFAIADTSGNTTPAVNTTQPDGEAIPWGIGKLVDLAQSVPMPSASQSMGASAQATAVKTTVIPSASGEVAAVSSTPSGMSSVVSSGTPTGSASGASGSPTTAGSASNTNGAGSLEVNGHVFRAVVALGVAALTFAVAL